MEPIVQDLLFAAAVLGALALVLELGFRVGLRHGRDRDTTASGTVGAIQGAVLGLLGLLLAFTFGGAASRFLEKQDLITAEANAIGTAYLRAGLLEEPHRSALRESLVAYTADRVGFSRQLRDGLTMEMAESIERAHADIWRAARAGAVAQPQFAVAILGPVNEVIDLHSTRVASGRKHIPTLVMGLLGACSLVATAAIGYGCGLTGKRRAPLTISLAVLIGTALWITIDLDHPRAGLMQLNDQPLAALRLDPTVDEPR